MGHGATGEAATRCQTNNWSLNRDSVTLPSAAIAAAAMVKSSSKEVGVIIKAGSDVANGPGCVSLETRSETRIADRQSFNMKKGGRKLLRRRSCSTEA